MKILGIVNYLFIIGTRPFVIIYTILNIIQYIKKKNNLSYGLLIISKDGCQHWQ